MVRKIAIVGMSDDTRMIPPDHEVWVIALYIGHFTRYDRAFECHEEAGGSSVLRMFIDDPWCEFYVPDHLKALYPKAKTIPCEELSKKYFPSFGSTISYMIALAIYERVDEISLYGVDMDLEDIYHTQRPSTYYWLGVANGLGITTTGLLEEEIYGRLQ